MANKPKPSKVADMKAVEVAPPVPAERRLQIAVATLGGIGAVIWLGMGTGRGIGWIRWLMIAVAAVVASLPPVARCIARALDRMRRPSRRSINWATLLIALVSAGYFILTAINQQRDLFPKTHDDCSYAIGMQMLAHGRLWEPALPLPDFFDSFYLLVRPAYCSLYFPGTGLLYVPTVWLHLPTCLMPAIASGAVVAMMYRITTELIDGAAGALAAFMVASLSWFRVYSVLLTSHVPMLLMGLVLIWLWLRWHEAHKTRWAFAIGAIAGWAAITRPADAVIFAVPIGCAIAWDLFRVRDRKIVLTPIAIITAAAPFLALQIIFDLGVTGKPLRAPYGYYLEQDQPGSSFGFHAYDPAAHPKSPLLQKQENYDRWTRNYLVIHTPGHLVRQWAGTNFPMMADVTMPCRVMLIFFPIGLLGLAERRRRIVFLTLPLFVLVYAFNPFFLEHYAIVTIPAVALTILLGGRIICRAWPGRERELTCAFSAIIFIASLTGFWEVNTLVATAGTQVSDETFQSDYLRNIHLYLPVLVDQPALVLFTFHPGDNTFEEPVYNTDVEWPDDAPLIRAHDLGPRRNREIFAYYARIQPDRTIYIFDWSKRSSPAGPLKRLGTAWELERAGP